MIPLGTIRKRCWRCKKLILVPAIIPCDNRIYLNGVWLTTMDSDSREHNIGGLCEQCAFDVIDWKESEYDLALGFQGGIITYLDLWEAMLTRKEK